MWLIALLGCESVEPVTLAAVQTGVFDKSCASSDCHGHGATEGDLDLSKDGAYAALVDVPGTTGDILVVPSDSEASYLLWKIEGREGIAGDIMAVDDDQLSLVRSWIDGGAVGGARGN
jgi:hypothetical protein